MIEIKFFCDSCDARETITTNDPYQDIIDVMPQPWVTATGHNGIKILCSEYCTSNKNG